jgi:hypothetical protein
LSIIKYEELLHCLRVVNSRAGFALIRQRLSATLA